jgi:hypothetical protein
VVRKSGPLGTPLDYGRRTGPQTVPPTDQRGGLWTRADAQIDLVTYGDCSLSRYEGSLFVVAAHLLHFRDRDCPRVYGL